MGPTRFRKLGGDVGGRIVNAPPTTPQNGSGGAGSLPGAIRLPGASSGWAGLNFSPAIGELSDVTTGRITLGMVNLVIVGMLAFYWWTRSAQGGG